MGPRVIRIDGRDELHPLPLDALVVLPLAAVAVREVVCTLHALEKVVGRLPRHTGIARLEREPELFDEAEVGRVHRPDDLAAELHRPAAVLRKLLDAAADPPAGLEHEDVRACTGEVPRRGQSGQAGAEDEDVGQPRELATNRGSARGLAGLLRAQETEVEHGVDPVAGRGQPPGGSGRVDGASEIEPSRRPSSTRVVSRFSQARYEASTRGRSSSSNRKLLQTSFQSARCSANGAWGWMLMSSARSTFTAPVVAPRSSVSSAVSHRSSAQENALLRSSRRLAK